MNIINYISTMAVPLVIVIIIIYGIIDKKKVYDIFLDGAKDGMKIVIKIFPTLLGIFLAVGALRSSGLLEIITQAVSPITNKIGFPSQVIPLALLRPISGSASLAVATDIMTTYGVDSRIGLITSTIMGSTETTFYTIAVYTSCIGVKRIRFVLVAALIADLVGMIASAIVWNCIG
ncbi:MAG: spore maturation protein [Clostridia bacterium]